MVNKKIEIIDPDLEEFIKDFYEKHSELMKQLEVK
jgi:hypothetical protein